MTFSPTPHGRSHGRRSATISPTPLGAFSRVLTAALGDALTETLSAAFSLTLLGGGYGILARFMAFAKRGRDGVSQRGGASYVAPWLLAWLLPTVALHGWYVRALLVGGLHDGTQLITGRASSPAALFGGYVFPADAIDVAVLVGVLWLLGRAVRVSTRLLMAISLTAALVALAVTFLAFRETGALPTSEALRVTFNWGAGNLALLGEILTWRRIAVLGGGLIYVALAIALPARLSAARGPARGLLPAIVIIIVGVSLALRADELIVSRRPTVTTGLWRSLASSMWGLGRPSLLRSEVKSPQELVADAQRLAFPNGRPAAPVVAVPAAPLVPRHVIVIVLETAARQFYPFVDDESWPALHALSAHAVISRQHYACSPTSNEAVFGIFSGTYPPPGAGIARTGHFTTDGLATVLRARGYETTYVDSYDTQWNGPDQHQMIGDLGFSAIHDPVSDPLPFAGDRFVDAVNRERRSFDLALQALDAAESHQRRALVAVVTHIGHYDWPALTALANPSALERQREIGKVLDTEIGRFVAALRSRDLDDDSIVVVVGDHGLRFAMEFEALEKTPQYGDLTFNVPFLLYAPALFPSQVVLPHATSHVDLAPTLLDLVGARPTGGVYDGANLFDGALAQRVVFLPSGEFPGLAPVNGFHWRSQFFARDEVTGRVTVRRGGSTDESEVIDDDRRAGWSAEDVRRNLASFVKHTEEVAAYFLRRGAGAGAEPGTPNRRTQNPEPRNPNEK